MSFAVWNWIKVYARWRESYLSTRPESRLFPWISRGFGVLDKPIPEAIEEARPEDPIITLGPRGETIKNKGILVVLAILAFLALSGDSK